MLHPDEWKWQDNSHDQEILEALQERLDFRLQSQGGYPAEIDGETIPGWVVVADVNHKEAPELLIYRWPHLRGWYWRAKELLNEVGDEDPDFTIADALCEVEDDVP